MSLWKDLLEATVVTSSFSSVNAPVTQCYLAERLQGSASAAIHSHDPGSSEASRPRTTSTSSDQPITETSTLALR